MVFGTRRRRQAGQDGGFPAIPAGAGLLGLQVVDPAGAPLRGVEVTATDVADGQAVVLGVSDPFGSFVAAVRPGDYRIALAADGFRTLRTSAQITAGETTQLGRSEMEVTEPPEPPAPGYWEIDPGHTAIRFVAQHLGMASVHGRFENFAGSLYVADRVEDSSVEITIDASSISTSVARRDDHLRSADFLDVARYPYLHFVSDRFAHRSGAGWSVGGTLTLHGVSRSVKLDTRYFGIGTGMEGETRAACFATTELHREDFTLNWRQMLAKGIAAIGMTIRVELDVQAVYRGTQPPADWTR